jgi:DNA-binding HxlR family transcriptional regulator
MQGQQATCPIAFALEIFGDRWTLLVLRDVLLEGRFRYNEILRANSGLATNILTDRLKRLEGRGLLLRRRDPQDGRQYLYFPTEQAIGLIPMLLEMVIWSAGQGSGPLPKGFAERFENEREAMIGELQDDVREKVAAL